MVRGLMRDREEPIAVVVDDERTMKFRGYVTWREVIQVTSHLSPVRVRDISLDYPVAYLDDNVEDVVKRMEEEKVVGLPVVRSKEVDEVVGAVTVWDLLRGLMSAELQPIAETVEEVATKEDVERFLVEPTLEVTKVWSDFIYRGVLGKVVVRSLNDPVPIGIVTPKEFIETSRWFFHRESERGLKSIAKVRTVMLRGVPVATPDTPVHYVAKVVLENMLTMVPVVDPDKGFVEGVVTVFDVLRAYVEGAKPGRVRPAVKVPLPLPAEREEKVVYSSTSKLLTQQVVAPREAKTELIGLRAADVARPELPAVSINDTVEHARREMIRWRTSYLVALDDSGRIVGVITKWSMLRAIATRGPIWRRRPRDRYFIDYVIDANVPKVSADASIEEVAYVMAENRSEVVMVVGKEGELVGFITKDDVVKAYLDHEAGRARIENVMTPGRVGIVHPHHSLHHVVRRMQAFYLDALTVYDGSRINGVVSANRLPFVALEDSRIGSKSRRLIWVRKLVKGAERRARYVKVTPLLAMDVMVPLKAWVEPEDDVAKAIRLMFDNNVDGVPVATREGKVLGVVCKNDVIRELARTALRRKELGLTLKVEGKPRTRT
jgi:CBS domain-containing protein